MSTKKLPPVFKNFEVLANAEGNFKAKSNLGSTKATSNLLLHLKESLIHFILCLDLFCGVVIFNTITDFTCHSTGYQNHSYILYQICRPVNNHFMDLNILVNITC